MYDAYHRVFERCGLRSGPSRPRPARSAATSTTSSWPWRRWARTTSCGAGRATTPPTSKPRCGRRRPRRPGRAAQPTRQAAEDIHTPGPARHQGRGRVPRRRAGRDAQVHRLRRRRRASGLALVPGDREVNPFALDQALPGRKVRLCEDADFDAHPDVPKGYIGPHFPGATVRRRRPRRRGPQRRRWVTGANQVDHHVRARRARPRLRRRHVGRPGDGRDRRRLPPLRRAAVGRPRHRGRPHLPARHQVLGGARRRATPTRRATQHPMVMGCYGIGVSRVVAAVVEEHHDDAGLVWPAALAPYDVHLVGLPGEGEAAAEVGPRPTALYDELAGGGARGALRRPRPQPRREVRRRRPPRHADAARRWGPKGSRGASSSGRTGAAESATRWPWRRWSGSVSGR